MFSARTWRAPRHRQGCRKQPKGSSLASTLGKVRISISTETHCRTPLLAEAGATATQQEIAEAAIAILADGKGLPPGRGDYAAGKAVYETACAACHGPDLKGLAGLPDMPSGLALRSTAAWKAGFLDVSGIVGVPGNWRGRSGTF